MLGSINNLLWAWWCWAHWNCARARNRLQQKGTKYVYRDTRFLKETIERGLLMTWHPRMCTFNESSLKVLPHRLHEDNPASDYFQFAGHDNKSDRAKCTNKTIAEGRILPLIKLRCEGETKIAHCGMGLPQDRSSYAMAVLKTMTWSILLNNFKWWQAHATAISFVTVCWIDNKPDHANVPIKLLLRVTFDL